MRLIIAAIVCFCLTEASFAGVYELTFRRVAAPENGQACLDFISQTAQNFADQTQASVIDYGCRPDEFSSREIVAVITYQNTERYAVTTTYAAPYNATSFYSDFEECKAQLPLQQELFAQHTGLQPLTAYCMQDVSSRSRWSTRVDGLGESEVEPSSVGLMFWGSLIDVDAIYENYYQAARSSGLTVFEAGISFGGIGHKLVLRVYGNEHYSLNDYDKMIYTSKEACLAASKKVSSFLARTEKPVVVFCEKAGNRGKTILHVTDFVKILEPKSVYSVKTLASQYATMDACTQAADRIGNGLDDIFGAACAGSGTDYRIHLFTK